jgi:hypothetical protein
VGQTNILWAVPKLINKLIHELINPFIKERRDWPVICEE